MVHRHNVVFGVAATVFILVALGFLLMESVAWVSRRDVQLRKGEGRPPRSGYFGLVSDVMTGPPMKGYRKMALTVMAVSGIVGLAALLL
jgi:hypothetical protein